VAKAYRGLQVVLEARASVSAKNYGWGKPQGRKTMSGALLQHRRGQGQRPRATIPVCLLRGCIKGWEREVKEGRNLTWQGWVREQGWVGGPCMLSVVSNDRGCDRIVDLIGQGG